VPRGAGEGRYAGRRKSGRRYGASRPRRRGAFARRDGSFTPRRWRNVSFAYGPRVMGLARSARSTSARCTTGRRLRSSATYLDGPRRPWRLALSWCELSSPLESPASGPRVVGRYALYGEIASGGMATVHFGRLIGPAGFARPVAIKRLHAQFSRDPEFVRMFLDEARLAARVIHPNVVATLDVVTAGGEVFLVMEYVPGATLAQLARTARKRGERIQPLVALGVVSGMLQGLHAAHESKSDTGEPLDLVHRDGVTRLLDFGVAKASGRLQTTRDGQLKGKLAYMAPEQVRGEPLTRRTDIYGASVVLWEVLTGLRLFHAENEAHVLSNVLSAAVPEPSSIAPELPRALDRVVLRGLDRDPARRYRTAREMSAAIDACIGVASPTEIGDWVERTAGDELRDRASRIAAIERSAAQSAHAPPQRLTTLERAPRVSSARAIGDPGDSRGDPWEATRNDRARGTGPAGSSSVPSGVALLPKHRSRKRAFALVGASVAILVGSVSLSFHSDTKPAPPSLLASSRASRVMPTPANATDSIPKDAVTSASVEDPGAVEPAPAAPPTLPLAKPTRSARPVPFVGHPGPNDSSRAVREADCDPPYTTDDKGHLHFKPRCL
jgi:eukaryotic-like serine/threonine-protein kinase